METKAFPSKVTMLQDLVQRVEGLDLNASAFFPKFSFVTTKGDTFLCPNAMTFVQDFNKIFGEVLDINGCRTVGGGRGKCILTFLDKTSKEVTKVITPTEAEFIAEVVEEDVPETPSEEDTVPKFDLEYASSLQEGKSKKEAKGALEAYGRTLNIELNKQKSFANMIKELQEAL